MNDWPLLKLGDVATVTAGTSAPQGDKYFDGGQFNFVRTQDVGRYGFTTSLIETKDRVNELAIREKRLKKARKGASVFPKSGASILTNSRAMLGCDSYIVSHLAIVDANHALLDDYYLHYFLRTVDFGEIAQSEEGYPSLRLSEVSELAIPVPPIDEQRRIVARIEELIRRAEESAVSCGRKRWKKLAIQLQRLLTSCFTTCPGAVGNRLELMQNFKVDTHSKVNGSAKEECGFLETRISTMMQSNGLMTKPFSYPMPWCMNLNGLPFLKVTLYSPWIVRS